MAQSHRAVIWLVLLVAVVVYLWPAAPPNVVTDGNAPLANTVIKIQGHPGGVLSDSRGQFFLPPTGKASFRVTAWHEGYGIGSASLGRLPVQFQLVPLPAADNDNYRWIDPEPDAVRPNNCGNCHSEIYREWADSGHARSATNPRFLRQYQRLIADRPDDIGVCARCHAPTYRDPALDYDLRRVQGVDAHGVHCDYCHKIVDAPTDKIGLRFGSDGYGLLRPADGKQLFFGPLDDAVREGEMFGYSPLYKQSRYCASCHEGVIYGVHVYGTYSEWLAGP